MVGQAIPNEKKTFYQQVLKLGSNEASAKGMAKGLQIALQNECHTNCFYKVMGV